MTASPVRGVPSWRQAANGYVVLATQDRETQLTLQAKIEPKAHKGKTVAGTLLRSRDHIIGALFTRGEAMEPRQLEYFIHVAELGSFTKAAAILNVRQPALSRQVHSPEIELRQNLFYRIGRGLAVAEAGKCLPAHRQVILLQFKSLS